jgi:hypothetical protein
MACPRGYRGRHTGLYRDTEGKQPRAGNLRTNFQARRPSRQAARDECAGRRGDAYGRVADVSGAHRGRLGGAPRARR